MRAISIGDKPLNVPSAQRAIRELPFSVESADRQLAGGPALLAALEETGQPVMRWYQMEQPALLLGSCLNPSPRSDTALRNGNAMAAGHGLGSQAHYDRVMTSAFCGTCHPAIHAEHALNTHGRAFTDVWAELQDRRLQKTTSIGALMEVLNEDVAEELNGATIAIEKV